MMNRPLFPAAIAVALCAALLAGCSRFAASGPTAESSAETAASQPLPSPEPAATPAAESSTALSAADFLADSEQIDRFKTYLQFLTDYVYEPCEVTDLASHQMVDPAILLCALNTDREETSDAVVTLNAQDVVQWCDNLFGVSLQPDQLDEETRYCLFLGYDASAQTISARTFSDTIAIRGYGADMNALQFQADGSELYVTVPILAIQDRGIYEPYQTLCYRFALWQTGTGAPYYQLKSVTSPEAEEKAQFLDFWEDSDFASRINDPDWTEYLEESLDYYFVVSIYLENHAERLGETILYDTDGAPCFPYEDFLGAAQAIFGEDTDYTAYIPNEPGPEGTTRAAWGYGDTYVHAELDENSFVLNGDTITIQALRRWVEPGYTEELGTLTYTFAVQPDNEYCRYRLVSLEEAS